MAEKKTFPELASEFTKDNVMELIKQVAVYEHKYGREVGEDLMVGFLEALIGTMIFNSLSRPKHDSKPPTRKPKDQYEEEEDPSYEDATQAFLRVKAKIQEAISGGFQGSLQTFTGKNVDYHCTINPIPEPPTKLVC